MIDDEHGRPTSTWDKLPSDVRSAMAGVLDNGDIPPRALALYARWWQLETWLRSLAYVELRSRDGCDWVSSLGQQALQRQQKDAPYRYMASPDWDDPLAYLDASRLLALIESQWQLFEQVMPARETWDARRAELLSIRNRIGHLRRPHQDDLARLEQTLRDLEQGAFRAVSSYNRYLPVLHLDSEDPVVVADKMDSFPSSPGLVKHADRQYEIRVRLSFTVRPWADGLRLGERASGTPGILWHVGFYARQRRIDVGKLWHDLSPLTRQVALHVLTSDGSHIEMTIPAVEEAELVTTAIGDMLHSVLRCSRAVGNEEGITFNELWRRPPSIDSRVQINTLWSSVDETMKPITLFAAGGGIQY